LWLSKPQRYTKQFVKEVRLKDEMRLVVFGATGKTGRLLVEQALDAGNEGVA
jgi:hypothetical protein